MPEKPVKKQEKRVVHRPMPSDPRQLAKAMFDAADEKVGSDESGCSDPSEKITATHKGILPIGGLQLECYVLADGRRVFHKRGMAKAMGLKSEGGNAFMKTLLGKSLDPKSTITCAKRSKTPLFSMLLGWIQPTDTKLNFWLISARQSCVPARPESSLNGNSPWHDRRRPLSTPWQTSASSH